jgi:predicted DNA-binding transcriptional regulator AlpA
VSPPRKRAPITAYEALTEQFYAWEKRGRGWAIGDYPVALEPPFRPFYGHYIAAESILDDARRPSFFGGIFERFRGETGAGTGSDDLMIADPDEPEPEPFESEADLVEIQIALPPDIKVSKDVAEQFVMSLGQVSRPAGFEIVGTKDAVVMQIACGEPDRRQVREQLHAYFPDALLAERNGYVRGLWDETGAAAAVVVEFGLSNEFMRPLRCFDRFEPDPLAGLIGAMGELSQGEAAVFQVLFVPTRHPWPENILRAVTDDDGKAFFADDPAMLSLAGQKIARPLFAAVIRVAAESARGDRAWRIAQGIGKALRPFADPKSNELIPLTNDGYDDREHTADVVLRQSRRTGMLLNSDELVSFVHLPSPTVRAEKLKRQDKRTKALPALALGHALILGENTHGGKTVRVTQSSEHRLRHTYVVGASGTGKSTLLLDMITQDISHGEGIAVLDPHGDLIDQVVGHIPEERARDVVLFDPSDEAYPVGFNILSAHSELERNLLASDLVAVFKRLSTSWGDQMTAVFGNAILAFLESDEGGTLADLRRFLVETDFRKSFLQTVRDAEVVYYWEKEFPLLTGKPHAPILTRLDTFLRPKVVRHMVSQKRNLDFRAIMDGRQIFLAKLSQGLIGEENSHLLGALLVSKLNQMALSRQDIHASERKPFYVYIDEFHNFVTPSMAAILSGARKFSMGLIIAHQELQQLASRESDIASAVISNPYTRICFRLGDFDAKKLAEGFSSFNAKDLQNLGIGEAICRIERSEYDFNLRTLPLPPVEPELARRRAELIVASSRDLYATRREDVEALLSAHRAEAGAPPAERTARKRPERAEPAPEPVREKQLTGEPLPETTPTVPVAGRGGEHHKYLQQLVKRWAEGRGYEVTIEKPILDGLGWVDVALQKGERSIACEISVSTAADHELGNVQKCLAAGFSEVILISSEKSQLTAVKHAAIAALSPQQYKLVKFLTPEQVFSYIESLEATAGGRAGTVDPNELMTAKEVEELLRIDVKTIYSYVKRGLLPYVKIQSNVRFLRPAILQWMEERQFKPGTRGPRK